MWAVSFQDKPRTREGETMIYFVVAQRDENGEWELVFGPKGEIEDIDLKVSELEENPKYSQVEIARVITADDKLEQTDWIDL